ncbi:aldose 1-epimerase family protein [Chloroflexi bacterium TSY]|nr:aldose 1-epimerase family protein [Chloroflexi bacterium TSY]
MSLGLPRNHGCRISDDWTYKGMRTVVLENELLRVTVLIDKGTDIVEFRYKPLDLDYLLMLPGGIRNPRHDIPSAAFDEPFHDYYSGGWNDIVPSGGPPNVYKGAVFGQHGEVSLVPWEYAILEDSPQRVSVRFWVRSVRTPFFLQKTMSLESERAVLSIDESLTNEGGEPLDFMWLQHLAFGRPFLDVPARKFAVHDTMDGYEPRRFQPGATGAWPHVPAPDGSGEDASRVPPYGKMKAQVMAYILELEEGWYAITNPVRKTGFALHFDQTLYPYIWYWQQLGDVAQGYPWWGRTHCAALEPCTSYPGGGLAHAVQNETARSLQPGEEIRTSLHAVAYTGLERVAQVTSDGEVQS